MKSYRRLLRKKNPTGEEVGIALVEESCRIVFDEPEQFKDSEISDLIDKIPPDSSEKTMLNFYLGAVSAAGRIELFCKKQLEEIRGINWHLSLLCYANKEALLKDRKVFAKTKFKDIVSELSEEYETVFDGNGWGIHARLDTVLIQFAYIRIRVANIIIANKFLQMLSDSLGYESSLYAAYVTDVCERAEWMFKHPDSVFSESPYSPFADLRVACTPLFQKETVLTGYHFDEDGEYSSLELIRLKGIRERIKLGMMIKDAQFSDQIWNEFVEFSDMAWAKKVMRSDMKEAIPI